MNSLEFAISRARRLRYLPSAEFHELVNLRNEVRTLRDEADILRRQLGEAIKNQVVIVRPVVEKKPEPLTPCRSMAQTIKALIRSQYNITEPELIGVSRHAAYVRARQIAMYLCSKHTTLSLPQVGRLFGNRDHTTVLNAKNKMAQRRADPAVHEELLTLERILGVA